MIDKRYRVELKSKLGNEWLIDLRPGDSPSGAPSPESMRVGADGFSLSYKGSGSEFTTPLRGSEVSIIFIVENSNDEEFISDISSEQDQTYVIELLKKNGAIYESYWTGYVWPEGVQVSYASYPYTVEIKASDSVARFKEYKGFQYNATRIWEYIQQVFANYSPLGTIVQDGNIVLAPSGTGSQQKLRLASTYISGVSLPSETNLWYNLHKSNSEAYPFNINTIHNRLKTITDWLTMWGCRVFLEEGYYKIIEFRYHATGAVVWANHDINGVPDGTTTSENLEIQTGVDNVVMDGGRFFFKRPMRGCELTYINNVGNPANKVTDTRTFSLTNPRNVKVLKIDFGEIWSYKLGHEVTTTGTPTDVTNNIGNDTTPGPTDLVTIFQDNMEHFYSSPQKYFQGSITSSQLKFSSLLILKSEKYVANNLTFTAAMDMWEGEWVKVGEDANPNFISKTSLSQVDSKTSNINIIFKE